MTNKGNNIEEWRTRYLASRKADKRKNVLVVLSAMLVLFFCSLITYYRWTDELKFIGKKTEYVYAVVTDERMIHWGKGYYYQVGNCDYIVGGEKYETNFRINDYSLWARVGDTVVLKIAIDNPKISKIQP